MAVKTEAGKPDWADGKGEDMGQQTHTPTPWFIEDSDPQFVNFEKGTVAEAHGANKENRFANAAFIVRAVNREHVFEELLAAAKEMREYCIQHACVDKDSFGVQGWNQAISNAEKQ